MSILTCISRSSVIWCSSCSSIICCSSWLVFDRHRHKNHYPIHAFEKFCALGNHRTVVRTLVIWKSACLWASICIYFLRSQVLVLQRCSYSAVTKFGRSSMSTVRFWLQFWTNVLFPGSLLLLFPWFFLSWKTKRGPGGSLTSSRCLWQGLVFFAAIEEFWGITMQKFTHPNQQLPFRSKPSNEFPEDCNNYWSISRPHIFIWLKILDHDGHCSRWTF